MSKKELFERIMLKVTSSKFWAALAVFVVSVMVLNGADANSTEKITAMIIAFGDLIVYTFANVWQKSIIYTDGTEDTEEEENQE